MRRTPSHAGRLSRWERLTFAVVFTLMGTFVAVVTVSAARAHLHGSALPSSAINGSVPAGPAATPAQAPLAGNGGGTPDVTGRVVPDSVNQELTTALSPVLARQHGSMAVGVIDLTTGARAVFAGSRSFPAAGVASTDILAALLLRHQGSVPLSRGDRDLARVMIEDSAGAAAAKLWREAGGSAGLTSANDKLHLKHTALGGSPYRAMASTTVDDQLSLLADLATARSPLSAASRSYALRLLRHAEPGQAWGVTEAASAGTASAVKDGWLPAGPGRLWVTDSIGVIDRKGQLLLVAVLSDDQPTQTAGIDQVEAAAVAAVDAVARPAAQRRQSG
jgi:beta-lactamase class A